MDDPRGTSNRLSGRVSGPVVQAGSVSGGVHFHVAHMSAEGRTTPRQLPPAARSFTGRDRDVGRLVDLGRRTDKERGSSTVAVVTGMPGVGKTAVAVRVAHLLADDYPDGQFFLDLHAHTAGREPLRAEDALASLLAGDGLAPGFLPAGLPERTALWRSRTAERRILLVLDNAADHAQVEPLLPSAPGAFVLVTSRRRLPALDADAVALDTLAEADAARLFRRLTDGDDADPDDVGRLVRWCGRLPLAITLLAGVFRAHPAWSLTDLVSDVSAATDRLGRFRAEDRAVAAAFDLSYERLPGERRLLFRRLGLHPGTSFDAHTAAVLADLSVEAAAEHLNGLYENHLLEETSYRRYRMHDLVRDYARTSAAHEPQADRDRAVTRLLDAYIRTASTASRAVTRRSGAAARPSADAPPGPADPAQALAWLHAECANLVACIDHADRRGDDPRVLGLTAPVTDFLRHAGPWDVAVRCIERGIAAARRLGDVRGEADARRDLGTVRSLVGDYPAAGEALTAALRMYRANGDRAGEAVALTELGVVHQRQGDHDEAVRLQESALAIHQEVGDRRGQAMAWCALGKVRLLLGDYPEARRLQEAALEVFQAHGDRLAEANSRTELGALGWLTGDYPAAVRSLDQAVTVYQEEAHPNGLANALRHLGIVAQVTGDYGRAVALQSRVLGIFRTTGNHRGEANTLTELGIARWLSGDLAGSEDALRRGYRLHRDIHDRRGEAADLHQLGAVCRMTGRYAEAVGLLRRALVIYQDIADRRGQSNVLNERANVLWLTGEHSQAAALLTDALAIQRAIGDEYGEANALQQLGAIRRLAGDHAAATDLLTRALDLQRTLGDRRGTAGTLCVLAAVHLADGRRPEADDALAEAQRICHQLGDRLGEAAVLNHYGVLHRDRGRSGEALAAHQSAVDLARSLGAPLEEAHGLEGIARALRQTGDEAGSAEALRQARDIHRRTGSAPDLLVVPLSDRRDRRPPPGDGPCGPAPVNPRC